MRTEDPRRWDRIAAVGWVRTRFLLGSSGGIRELDCGAASDLLPVILLLDGDMECIEALMPDAREKEPELQRREIEGILRHRDRESIEEPGPNCSAGEMLYESFHGAEREERNRQCG